MTDQLEPAVRTLIDAANAGNIEAFLSGFTVEGVATVHPGNRPTG
jgi:hypothetical protein